MLTNRKPWLPAVFLLVVLLTACQSMPKAAVQPAPPSHTVPVKTAQTALAQQTACTSRFVPRRLSVADGMRVREISTYLSNGAGVAAGDLDGNGTVDLVFGSVDHESTILWNGGNLNFTAESLDDPLTRAVNIVDVNGDGRLDIVFTHTSTGAVSYWRNTGSAGTGQRFVRDTLPGVDHYAYAMAWADMNDDGQLDLVTGAYDADLKSHGATAQDIEQKGGVVLYEQHNGRFEPQQLTNRSEALAIGLLDLNNDGKRDIWVANDFALPDGVWERNNDAWVPSQPFRQTSYSTMSIDWGDVANDGRTALFTSDMNPGDISPDILADWLPMMSKLEEKHGPSDPQIMANMLQIQSDNGQWRNEAASRGVDATGWSWSGQFGDLDNDGFLDLYVVNGMIAQNLFGHLPNAELVEPNRAFRNQGNGGFLDAPEWNLASTASGRGMLMADLDNDGDLDIVVNNLRSSAQLFENQVCKGDGLEVDLAWPTSPNTHTIGAELELYTSLGVLRRDVRSASGYLSGDSSRIHFGFPKGTTLQKLIIRYPDGSAAEVNSLAPQTLLEVTR